MGAVTREQIEGAKDVTIEAVEVPEWGGTAYVKVMSGSALDSLETTIVKNREGSEVDDNFRAQFLVRCLCDESGALLFDASGAKALGEKSSIPLKRLFVVAMRLNKWGESEDLKKS